MEAKTVPKTEWLKQYFIESKGDFVTMIHNSQNIEFLTQNKFMLALLRYVENLALLSSTQILKTCLLFVQLLRSNKPKVKISLEDYVFKNHTFTNISLPKHQKQLFMKIIQQVGVYLDILKQRQVDQKSQLCVFLKLNNLYYPLSTSKNQHIFKANTLLSHIIFERCCQMWEKIKDKIEQCFNCNDQDFLQFYEFYSLFCDVRKKMSNRSKKSIEISLEKNILMEKRYQQIKLRDFTRQSQQVSKKDEDESQENMYKIPQRNIAKLVQMFDISDEDQ